MSFLKAFWDVSKMNQYRQVQLLNCEDPIRIICENMINCCKNGETEWEVDEIVNRCFSYGDHEELEYYRQKVKQWAAHHAEFELIRRGYIVKYKGGVK